MIHGTRTTPTGSLFAVEGCPFCHYAGPSRILAETDDSFVIEPINPVTLGHVLVIPKRHVETAIDDPETTGVAFRRAAEWVNASDGDFNLIQSNGPAATQTVKHLHVHVVPRHGGDGLRLPWSES